MIDKLTTYTARSPQGRALVMVVEVDEVGHATITDSTGEELPADQLAQLLYALADQLALHAAPSSIEVSDVAGSHRIAIDCSAP